MSLAIKITQEVKDKNARYNLSFVEDNDVDSIIQRRYPNKFYVTEPVSGGYDTRTDLHALDGWKDVVVPPHDDETQIIGTELIDSDDRLTFTFRVIDLTAQEILDLIEQNNAEASTDSLNFNVSKGTALASKSYDRMYRRFLEEVSENNQLNLDDVQKYMDWNVLSYLALNQGNYYTADSIVKDIFITYETELTNSRPLEKMFEWFQLQIQDFIANEYDLK